MHQWSWLVIPPPWCVKLFRNAPATPVVTPVVNCNISECLKSVLGIAHVLKCEIITLIFIIGAVTNFSSSWQWLNQIGAPCKRMDAPLVFVCMWASMSCFKHDVATFAVRRNKMDYSNINYSNISMCLIIIIGTIEVLILNYNQIYNWTNMSWNYTAYFLDAERCC